MSGPEIPPAVLTLARVIGRCIAQAQDSATPEEIYERVVETLFDSEAEFGIEDIADAIGAIEARPTFIYVIAQTGTDLVKVGITNNVPGRLLKLQAMCGAPLELLGSFPGTYEDESAIHASLAAHHAHHEWFRRGPWLYELLTA